MRVTVLTAAKSAGIAGGLTYESDRGLLAGTMVTVPLRNRLTEGIILGEGGADTSFDLKSIQSAFANTPLLSPEHIRTMQWMAEYYHCSVRQAIRVFLPSPPWSSLLPAQKTGYRLVHQMELRGKKQQAVLEYLTSRDWVEWDELRTELGVTTQTVQKLCSLGCIEEVKQEEEFNTNTHHTPSRPTLSVDQKEAYESIASCKEPSLLFGITGSGKTEVYAQLVADAMEAGKQSIVLVPEILLTETSIHRFMQFAHPDTIAVLHSRLTPVQRREEWKRIRYGNIQLIIGSRSALFAPVTNLGLIVIDEEHEWTYKNEQTPRYHARETAEILCTKFGAKLVLGSATPSIESWHRTKTGRYHLAYLRKRFGSAELPKVSVVDLAQVQFGTMYPFSNTLLDAIQHRLDKKEQSVLFLNRKGIATSLMCMDCRRRIVSPESNLPFTVHRRGEQLYLQDHTTGAVAQVPTTCPACSSSNLRPIGAGTQKVEDILTHRFPTARILRADSETLSHPEQIRSLLHAMEHGEADILLGTQSVAKGLDLPNVTLAAVLVADVGMSLPHFRAGERVFQLLTQLTGRSGRSKPGEVVIQTFRPGSIEVKSAALHSTEEYLETELTMREAAGYPPIAELLRLILRGPNVQTRTETLAASILNVSSNLAVSAAPTLFGGGREWHIFVRGKNPKSILPQVDLTDVVVDIDPMDCV